MINVSLELPVGIRQLYHTCTHTILMLPYIVLKVCYERLIFGCLNARNLVAILEKLLRYMDH